MARGTAKLLFSIYSCKNRNLFAAMNSVSSRLIHHYRPALASSFAAVQIPNHLNSPQHELIHFTKFGAFSDFRAHRFCSLSENEKVSPDSTEILQNGAEANNFDEGERVLESNIKCRDPLELYKELKDAPESKMQSRSDWEAVNQILSCFSHSGWASNQALALYIGASFFPVAARRFSAFFLKKCDGALVEYLRSIGPGSEADKFLFPIFVEFCLEEFADEIKRFREMVESADMTKPHTWFPFARAMKRKIIYHCGPTNSGKTYNSRRYNNGGSGGTG